LAYLSNVSKNRLDHGELKNLLSPLMEPAMKKFLQFLAQQLVNNPSEVDVRETTGGLVSIRQQHPSKPGPAGGVGADRKKIACRFNMVRKGIRIDSGIEAKDQGGSGQRGEVT
jgi:hypothetical protein